MPKIKLSIDGDIDFFIASAEVSILHYEAKAEIRINRKRGTGTHPSLTQSSSDEVIVEHVELDNSVIDITDE